MSAAKKSKTVILGVTGSIAAYKACEIINLLRNDGMSVNVVLTEEAKEFITPLTLQTLSGSKVVCDMFEAIGEWNPLHTSLADRADLVLIAPATANIIGKLATGTCDDILSCIVFATKAPILIAPAMNSNMYNHDITQANIAALKRSGYRFIGPIKGHLACGRIAVGHIAETSDIVREAKRLLR